MSDDSSSGATGERDSRRAPPLCVLCLGARFLRWARQRSTFRRLLVRHLLLTALAALTLACAGRTPPPAPAPSATGARAPADTGQRGPATTLSTPNANPFPSTYTPFPSRPTVIRNATIMTAAGPTIRNGSV